MTKLYNFSDKRFDLPILKTFLWISFFSALVLFSGYAFSAVESVAPVSSSGSVYNLGGVQGTDFNALFAAQNPSRFLDLHNPPLVRLIDNANWQSATWGSPWILPSDYLVSGTPSCPVPSSGAAFTYNSATSMCERPVSAPASCTAGVSYSFSVPVGTAFINQCHNGCTGSVVSASDQFKVAGVQSVVGVAQQDGTSCTGTNLPQAAGAVSSYSQTGSTSASGNASIVAAPPNCSSGQTPVALPTGWMSCKNPDAAGIAAGLKAAVAGADAATNAAAVGAGAAAAAGAAASAAAAAGGSASQVQQAGVDAAAAYAAKPAGDAATAASSVSVAPPCDVTKDATCLGGLTTETVTTSNPTFSTSSVSFQSMASCPADIPLSFSVGGHAFNTPISFQPFCNFALLVRPLFLALAAISASIIFIAGLSL